MEERAKDGKIYQNKNEKMLNKHIFYRCHKFARNGKAKCQDEITAKAAHTFPRYAEALRDKAGQRGLRKQKKRDKLTANQRLNRFDFGVLELRQSPEHWEDLDKVAFGMISHITGPTKMSKFVNETKVGLWGYSADKDIAETAKKGTVYDHRASFDEAKLKIGDKSDPWSDEKTLTRRCWGHSAPIFYDAEQVKDFKELMSVTDSYHGVSGSPLWFMRNEQESDLMFQETDLMFLEPKTKRRIIGGVASCVKRGKYFLTEKYIENKKHRQRLSEKKIKVALDQAAVFNDEVVSWIELVTGQKCIRAKYDVTGKTKWSTGSFYQDKQE